jgi:hypothetical protein
VLTSDLAWLIGAAFAPLVALSLSGQFRSGFYGAICSQARCGTLVALWSTALQSNHWLRSAVPIVDPDFIATQQRLASWQQ